MEILYKKNWIIDSAIFPGVTITMKSMTVSEINNAYKVNMIESRPVKTFDANEYIINSVVSIENLSVKDETNKITEIKTGRQLLDTPALIDLYNEIIVNIYENSRGIDSKN